MANPQLEDGYVRIANEILEALFKFNLTGTELKVILFILRKTYGWQKKEDEISLSQFCESLNFSKPAICMALKQLQLVKIILLVSRGNSKKASNVYSFNKNHTEWQLVNKPKLVNDRKRTSKDLDNQLVNQPLHTKETITKETIQKKEYPTDIEQAQDATKPEKVKLPLLEPVIDPPVPAATPTEYGRKEINDMLVALKTKVGISAFVDSGIERNMAKHCVSLLGKIGKDEFVRRLEFLLNDPFHRKNCNKIKYIYNNIKGFIEPKTKSLGVFIS